MKNNPAKILSNLKKELRDRIKGAKALSNCYDTDTRFEEGRVAALEYIQEFIDWAEGTPIKKTRSKT